MAETPDLGSSRASDRRFVRRVGIVLLLGAGLALAACAGGGDDTADPPASTVPVVSDAPASTAPDAGSQAVVEDPGGDAEGSVATGLGTKQAVVVIGDERFEFDMSTTCVSIGGAVGGTGLDADGSVQINIDISPEDWETSADGWDAPAIRVEDERDADIQPDWRAGGEVVAGYEDISGIARVEAYTVEGSRASGSATFIDLRAYDLAMALGDPLPDPVAGTFEINCG